MTAHIQTDLFPVTTLPPVMAAPVSDGYYPAMAEVADAYLTDYRDDYRVHDRRAVEGYSGELLWAIRETGTTLLLLDAPDMADEKKWPVALGIGSADREDVITPMMFHGNQRFFHGAEGKLREISRERAQDIYQARAKRPKWTIRLFA